MKHIVLKLLGSFAAAGAVVILSTALVVLFVHCSAAHADDERAVGHFFNG